VVKKNVNEEEGTPREGQLFVAVRVRRGLVIRAYLSVSIGNNPHRHISLVCNLTGRITNIPNGST
jgi:hypothetical protein